MTDLQIGVYSLTDNHPNLSFFISLDKEDLYQILKWLDAEREVQLKLGSPFQGFQMSCTNLSVHAVIPALPDQGGIFFRTVSVKECRELSNKPMVFCVARVQLNQICWEFKLFGDSAIYYTFPLDRWKILDFLGEVKAGTKATVKKPTNGINGWHATPQGFLCKENDLVWSEGYDHLDNQTIMLEPNAERPFKYRDPSGKLWLLSRDWLIPAEN